MSTPTGAGRAAVPPEAVVHELISGFQRTQLLYVMAALGLADRLQDGPKSSEALARASGAHPHALARLLRALASLGVVDYVAPDTFALTPLSACLLSDAPGSLRTMALVAGALNYRAWGELLHSVTTGQTAFERAHGMGFFAYLAQHPDLASLFDEQMAGGFERRNAAIVAAYDFSALRTIVDVGGGLGGLIAAILVAYPSLRGILVDLPHVVAGAAPVLAAAGVADRCQVVAGDFFQAVPAGGDAYLLAGVLHDWDDEAAGVILRNCRAAMAGDGRVLVAEQVAPPGNAPFPAALLDVAMLVNTGGRERTAAEFDGLFSAAGLRLTTIMRTGWGRLLEGVAVEPAAD